MLRSNFHFLTLTFLFFTGACDPSKGETDSATGSTTESTTEATTGDSTTGEPTTAPSVGEGSEATGDDDPPVATSGEDTEGDTTSSTTGPVDPEHQSACEAACDNMAKCDDTVDAAECAVGCAEEFQEIDSGCVPANLALVQCISGLSCFDLEEQTDEGPCGDELEALLDCDGGNCKLAMSQGDDGCGLGRYCPDAPAREIDCTGDLCVCTEDGVEVAQCAADGVCLDGDAIFDKMDTCCGFE
ncbi:hypothetical protein [Nannocystis punicea]|uniref:Uncharacterized protein n=1 Tax=Nannocystis punicea TaxID=2995304 RepID=A0ABY7GWC5_9BACT|nr:hypothetical protein [Nannocystis poenicansa]WAS91232.1 hypothetical protein O0S08_34015 [Nannocystis poenicansa]